MTLRTIAALAAAIPLILMYTACEQSGQAPPSQIAPAGPRYPTADSLVAMINATCAAREARTTLDVIVDRCFAENDLQRRLLAAARVSVPVADLEHAAMSRFGPKGGDSPTSVFDIGPQGPLELISSDAERAVARGVDRTGSHREFQLVGIDGDWWISGASFEQDDRILRYEPVLEDIVRWLQGQMTVYPPVAHRIRRGEFESLRHVGRVLVEAAEPLRDRIDTDAQRRVMELYARERAR